MVLLSRRFGRGFIRNESCCLRHRPVFTSDARFSKLSHLSTNMEANSLAEVAVKPAVLTVGDELVSGDRQHNGNERWLLSQLYERGHPADIAMQLRDDAEQIGEYVRLLRSNGHFPILVAGGLGGTHDDKTREGVARALGVPLETHSECDSILSARYATVKGGYTEGRQRMAQLPRGCVLLANPIGAPGFAIGGVYAFPGFPTMLQPMATAVLDELFGQSHGVMSTVDRELMCPEGAIAAQVEAFANEWQASRGVSVGIYPSTAHYGSRVKLRLRYPTENADVAAAFQALVTRLESQIQA